MTHVKFIKFTTKTRKNNLKNGCGENFILYYYYRLTLKNQPYKCSKVNTKYE